MSNPFLPSSHFIWEKNKLSARQVEEHQASLLTSVFKITDIREFKESLKASVSVTTWDGKTRVWMSVDQIARMYKEMCLLGPLAAMFGREVQQTLMAPQLPTKIPVDDFQYSVDSGRASLSRERIKHVWNESVDAHHEDDRGSQTSKRTRSPRKMPYSGAIWEQHPHCRQVTDVREKSGARQSTEVRERSDDRQVRDRYDERHDDRRPTDVRAHSGYPREGDPRRPERERHHYTQSEPRYERETTDRSRRR